MGFVIRRGTRDNPRYFIRYIDVDGGEKTRKVPARTKVEADRFLHEVETRLTEGRLGMEPKGPAAMVVDLMDEWIATIVNRNAADDRSRFKRHLRPAFEGMTLVQATELGPIMKWVSFVWWVDARAEAHRRSRTSRWSSPPTSRQIHSLAFI